ncbi:hypothetical protein FB451DRAFT_253371 [Mycena latifolia]|nr:hypothetical protein FB451DRAFT_253371 [Mycena latifolia]
MAALNIPAPSNALTTPSNVLRLCTLSASVGLYPSPPARITSDTKVAELMRFQPMTSSEPLFSLLSADLHSFLRYTQLERSGWLIDIAHDICDSRFKRGFVVIWDKSGTQWRPVVPTDPLKAALYCYVLPPGTVVGLTKISKRVGKSKTTAAGNASTMRKDVVLRDSKCWVSGSHTVTNSHVCPVRMGDHLARHVLDTFCPGFPSSGRQVFDVMFGIALNPSIDTLFDHYKFGLRLIAPNTYEAHVFDDFQHPSQVYTIHGEYPAPPPFPLLHRHLATPPRRTPDNPHPGLFRWHYLQCVIQSFGHYDYTNFRNIQY